MKRKLLFVFLTILPFMAEAQTDEPIDFVYDGIHYQLDPTTMTAKLSSCPLTNHIVDAVIPETVSDNYTVTSIGEYAFSEISSLVTVTIPNSVTEIETQAFEFCTSLETVNFRNGLTTIGVSAFQGCSSLNNFTLPASLTSIGDGAFFGCTSLTAVSIPNLVTTIDEATFAYCTELTSLSIGSGVTTIYDAFQGCSKLASIKIANLTSWCNMDFPNDINPLTSAKHLYIGDDEIVNLVIPNGVTSIGDIAFKGCTGITSATIPSTVTSIGTSAFYGCTNLSSITLPNSSSLTIGANAFAGAGLTTIDIPANTTIQDGAFISCTSLTSVSMDNAITSLGKGAFSYCENLGTVNIPESLTEISEQAFYYCRSLTSVTIPNNVTSIGKSAFHGCELLQTVTIPENSQLETIGDYAFQNCVELASALLPNGVKYIGKSAFSACFKLSSFVIPEATISIGESAFDACYLLTSITIPNGVTSIGVEAFKHCRGLTSVISMIKGPFAINENVFQAWNYSTNSEGFTSATLYVPTGSEELYRDAAGWKEFTSIEKVPGFNVTLAKSMITYANSAALDFTTPIEGLKAYVVSEVTNNKAVLTEVTTAVPAGTGLILMGTATNTYEIPYTVGAIDEVINMLVGVTEDTAIGGNDLDYILSDGKFVKANAGTLSAGKAYLKLENALARGIVDIDESVTSIDNVLLMMSEGEAKVYNLNGQRISQPTKGLNIVNGKKVIRN